MTVRTGTGVAAHASPSSSSGSICRNQHACQARGLSSSRLPVAPSLTARPAPLRTPRSALSQEKRETVSQRNTADASESSPVIKKIVEQSARVLETYRVDPGLIQEHANGERRITQGGYGDRQLFELVQNAADEIANDPGGTIHSVLTETHLYCANEGTPVTPEGAETILRMSVSRKRGGQIGRFGVGVKSVLAITDTPQFFSTDTEHSSGSSTIFGFGFDREWAFSKISEARGAAPCAEFEAPVLRMARSLDVEKERGGDPVLDELLGWATTVVRLPLTAGAARRLAGDLHQGDKAGVQKEFPSRFLLFSHHVGTVVLEDRRAMPPIRRVIKVEHEGFRHTIHERRTGQQASRTDWKVFTHAHRPTEAARRSAGEMHDRGTIDIAWAVPEYSGDKLLTAPRGRGEFWSFFPTKYPMTLSGALNGAWKTNEDRQNLLDASPFNEEIIQVAARLVVDSLPHLTPPQDPGAYLPLLPGRTKESETLNWADQQLTEQIWEMAAQRPSLPDQDGVLRIPRDLHLHPDMGKRGKLKAQWLDLWNAYPGRPADWIHPSVEAAEIRSGKVEHIIAAAKQERATVREWLEALVADGSADASAVAIHILAEMINDASPFADEARTARIVLTEEHGLVAPVAGKVFRRTVQDGLKDDLVYADAKLSADVSLLSALNVIGIREADARGRFVGVLEQGFARYSDQDWTRFWELFHSAGGSHVTTEVRARVPHPLETLYVRTKDGRYHRMRDCMIPGRVVPGDGSRDVSVAVDMGFHSDDMAVFREFGLLDRPTGGYRPEDEPWFDEYRTAVFDAYCRTLDSNASRPQISRLKLEGAAIGGPLHLLPLLSDEGKAAFVKALPDESVIDVWTRQFGAQAATRKPVASPLRWMVRRHGLVETSKGVMRLANAAGPQLKAYSDVLPVADISPEKARKLHLPVVVDDVPESQWEQLMEELLRSEDDTFVGRTYVMLTRLQVGFPEDSLTRCRVGMEWDTREDGEIAVAATSDEYRALRAEQLPALLAGTPEDAELMIGQWGMLRYSDVISKETQRVTSGEPILLRDEFPALRQRLGNSVNNFDLQYCSELEEVVRTPNGMRATPLKSALEGTTVLVLTPADRLTTLTAADRELRWRLGESGCRAVLEAQDRQEQDQQLQDSLRAVREAASVVDKLELLIGADALRAGLPAGLFASEQADIGGATPSTQRIAQMAYNAHGDGVLQVHAKDLAAAYPSHAPSSFTGATRAVTFVSDLGFPDSFAGVRAPSLAPRVDVDGPTEFPRLHDYQERLATNVFTMLDRISPQRGMLSLPTGAGKTRVASEAVIRWIKQDGQLDGPILWIAQSEELCEQAVQSWQFVWSKVGADSPLAISRLWASNEAGPIGDRPHLVVATDAKLRVSLDTHAYAWLRKASLVIVDEAHMAIAPQYTEILALLGLTHSRTDRHLLGLTATPFRNTNVDETKRLIQRFGGRRLDDGIFNSDDPYSELQELGMLARVTHKELTGGSIELTRDEQDRADQLSVLSKAAEQRLADDNDRNRRIIDEILAMPERWPVLVFATSVGHAKFLAAKLNDKAITAAAVDSTTSPTERRRRIDSFRRRQTRVLTNYGVLTQGFDAPATRAVVVARPTYSPNMYQQMIGRGLRGPRNGGEDTCLILNVRDNIKNYDKALAFTRFEHLWSAK
ncbi:DEAD/DEAH box helicase family protein [Streptomyces durmitorensis]|uniref:DEAD/DEAH box helicase family protein n=1 Tax=Streptomyces durmitorensis TaxID=319947 RepID=A0ABY4PZE7_9ACTN|nr:DEAD/DEAH box helicase family protein [Streptomyces durmitorensis]UQT58338.1 DEAD/DEAH box helicase family protein [Streptomyces durmitorensis]